MLTAMKNATIACCRAGYATIFVAYRGCLSIGRRSNAGAEPHRAHRRSDSRDSTRPDDPSTHAAAAIAKATKEGLVIVEANGQDWGDAAIRQLAAETGVSVKRIRAAEQPLSHPGTWAQTFDALRERLVVMTRGPLAYEETSSIASARQVPVLVIGTLITAETAP
jgi:hypothetical protein